METIASTALQTLAARAGQGGGEKKACLGPDGLRRCPKCGSPLECLVAGLGKMPVMCRCAKERDQAERRARALRQRVEAAREMACSSPFYDPGYDRFTFAADRYRDDARLRQAGDKCRGFVEHFEALKAIPAGILLTGPVGTGKSFYASATVNALRETGVPAIIVSTARLLNVLRSSANRQAVMDELNRFEVVALDDLGAERDTEYALELLEAFVDARALGEKPLIVTTNLTPADIRRPADMRYMRLFDRVNSLCTIVVPLVQDSLRAAQARTRSARAREILSRPRGAM